MTSPPIEPAADTSARGGKFILQFLGLIGLFLILPIILHAALPAAVDRNGDVTVYSLGTGAMGAVIGGAIASLAAALYFAMKRAADPSNRERFKAYMIVAILGIFSNAGWAVTGIGQRITVADDYFRAPARRSFIAGPETEIRFADCSELLNVSISGTRHTTYYIACYDKSDRRTDVELSRLRVDAWPDIAARARARGVPVRDLKK